MSRTTLHEFKANSKISVAVDRGVSNQVYINFRNLFMNDEDDPIKMIEGLDLAVCLALIAQRREWYNARGMMYDPKKFTDLEFKVRNYYEIKRSGGDGVSSVSAAELKKAASKSSDIVDKEFSIMDFIKHIPSIPIADEGVRRHIPAVDPIWDYSLPMYSSVIESIIMNTPLILVGPTGTGKTSGILQVAAKSNNPVRRCPCNSSTSFSDLFGEVALVVDEAGNQITKRTDGWISWACRVGAWILLDEADSLDPAVALSLYPLLEEGHSGKRFITIPPGSGRPGGEIVEVHPNTRMFLTGNNFGTDTDMMYAGTEQIFSTAFLDRCEIVHVDYPSPDVVAGIVEKKAKIPNGVASSIAVIMAEINLSHKNDNLPWVFSLRRAIALGKKYHLYTHSPMEKKTPFTEAMNRVIYEGITNKDTRTVVKGICQRLGVTG